MDKADMQRLGCVIVYQAVPSDPDSALIPPATLLISAISHQLLMVLLFPSRNDYWLKHTNVVQ